MMKKHQYCSISDYYFFDENKIIEYSFMFKYKRYVYEKIVQGKQLKTGKAVTIKIYSRCKMDQQQKIQLDKQVKILKSINHPYLLNFSDFFQSKNCYFLIFEQLPKVSLCDLIIEKQNFTQNEARNIIIQVIDAVRYLHQQNIMHIDLNPENILYTPQAIIKIVEYGKSQILSQQFNNYLISEPTVISMYVAPQIIKGSTYNQKTNWWSVGVLLYTLLCGYPPFYSQQRDQIFDKIIKGEVYFQIDDWKNVSSDAKKLIEGLLNPDLEIRFGEKDIFQHVWIKKQITNQQEEGKNMNNFVSAQTQVMQEINFLNQQKDEI